jgi:hypothetical protein
MGLVRVKYTGSAPGANSNYYVLFNSVTAFPGAGYFQQFDNKRLLVNLKWDTGETITLRWYIPAADPTASPNGRPQAFAGGSTTAPNSTWNQIGEEATITAPAATSSEFRDFLVEPFTDFLLVAVNDGNAKTTWIVDMVLTDERSIAT